MKMLIIIVGFFISGCVGVNYDVENIKPNEVGFDETFVDKVFIISCRGTQYTGSKEVDTHCRQYASQFAFNRGYLYFSVLEQKAASDTTTESYRKNVPVTTYSDSSSYSNSESTTYISQREYYDVTTHRKSYTFVLINEDELKKWKNYYKVLDYYQPEEL